MDWSDGRLEVTSYPQRVVPDKPQAKLLARMEFVAVSMTVTSLLTGVTTLIARWFETYMRLPSGVSATAQGCIPAGIVAVTLSVTVSMMLIVPS